MCNIDVFYEKLNYILIQLCKRYHNKIDFKIDILKRNKYILNASFWALNLKLAISQPTRPASKSYLDNFAHNFRDRSLSTNYPNSY